MQEFKVWQARHQVELNSSGFKLESQIKKRQEQRIVQFVKSLNFNVWKCYIRDVRRIIEEVGRTRII